MNKTLLLCVIILFAILLSGVVYLFILLPDSQNNQNQAENTNLSSSIFYVSLDGNDSWSGRFASPNSKYTDGPFKSIEKARDTIRAIKIKNNFTEPVTVYIRGGIYYLQSTLLFTPEDSGTAQTPITYMAYPNERPIISAGRQIKGWGMQEGLWKATIPEVASGEWYFNQLFINDERRMRAHEPDSGYYNIISSIPDSVDFQYSEDDILEWSNLTDVIIKRYHLWTTSYHYINSISTEEKQVTLSGSLAPFTYKILKHSTRYKLENAPEFLDSPGEWYLDKKTGVITYFPYPGENLAEKTVLAPRFSTILYVNGDIKNKSFVDYVSFKDISFAHSDVDSPWEVFNGGDLASNWIGGALHFKGLRYSTISGCEVYNVGAYAMLLDAGSKNNTISKCHLHDLGSGGIMVGTEGYIPTDISDVSGNIINNNIIRRGGIIFNSAAGILVKRSSSTKITNNEIYDFDYSGIISGWSAAYTDSSANNTQIMYNYIHHIGRNVLSDMGGIYTSGPSEGTVIAYNLIHDVNSYLSNAFGIYNDRDSTGYLIYSNIVYNTENSTYFINTGKANRLYYNIFVAGNDSAIRKNKAEQHLSIDAQNNIVVGQKDLVKGRFDAKDYFNNNIYHSLSSDLIFMNVSFEQWVAKGNDVQSLLTDPEFVNAARYNFNLKSSSPALEKGFVQFNHSRIGLYGDRNWKSLPSLYPSRPNE